MRIDQALRSDGSESVRVQGFLVGYTGEPLRLCAELLESLPPQCGGPSLIAARERRASRARHLVGERLAIGSDPLRGLGLGGILGHRFTQYLPMVA